MGSLQDLISERCFHIAQIVVEKKTRAVVETSTDAFECAENNVGMDEKEVAVNKFITELQSYIWCRVVWYLYDKVRNLSKQNNINQISMTRLFITYLKELLRLWRL